MPIAATKAKPQPSFFATCKRAGVPVNVIDKPQYCQFQFGSIVNRSPVIVAISTDGGAPVLAQTIRRKIEALLPASLKDWARLAQNLRTRVGSMVTTAAARRHFWDIFADKAFSEPWTSSSETDLLAVASQEVSDAGECESLYRQSRRPRADDAQSHSRTASRRRYLFQQGHCSSNIGIRTT
ncbi:hypothetical protein HED63_28365 [Ochrobactrum cytisi]|nr:hypothetical protein [Brucella cytisi]